ncbi:MAG: hypothetical protein IT301_09840 [Dehalococcoidia bacterium]|nr:hypothetical protein [Dehalococcoidia bacterium]
MTACPRCAARFTGAPDIERLWIERHLRRHGTARIAPGTGDAEDHRLTAAA